MPSASPTIGISAADETTPSFQAMVKRVSEAGGIPFFITDHANHNITEDIARLNGLVVTGNDFDIDPIQYMHRYEEGDPRRAIHPETKSELYCQKGLARAKYENAMIKQALNRKMPLLAICGGMQRLNVLCGGTLIQHVPDLTGHDGLSQNYAADGKTPTRPVLIEPATRMSIIARKIQMSFVQAKTPGLPTVIMENSFRHQSIDMVGEGFRISALSDAIRLSDGTHRYLVEAIEPTPEGPYGAQFAIGVQWHPEFGASDIGKVLVKEFVAHAAAYA